MILIPAYNEAATVGTVITSVRAVCDYPIVVIDDCSTDETAIVALRAGATVLPLTLRLGAWGAIQTGLRYALSKQCLFALTLDADGQHDPAGLNNLLAPLLNNHADVVIGAFPARASQARRLAWRYFRWLTGLDLEDITSGFRAYNYSALKILASGAATLLDYQDIGVLLILRQRGLRILEIPVPMQARTTGASRVFYSWWTVGNYMLQTSVLCLAQVGGKIPTS